MYVNKMSKYICQTTMPIHCGLMSISIYNPSHILLAKYSVIVYLVPHHIWNSAQLIDIKVPCGYFVVCCKASHWHEATNYGLTLIPAWISNHMPSKQWIEIIYPFSNFNGAIVEISWRISNFSPHFIYAITYPYWELIHVSNRALGLIVA